MPVIPDLREEIRYAGLPGHVRNIAEILAEFDPDLYICRLPEGHPQFNPDRPWSVVVRPAGREQYVYGNYMESQIDARIVAEFITRANNTATGGSYDEFAALQKAWEIVKAKREQEEREQKREMTKDLLALGNRYNYARHNGRILSTDEPVAAPTSIYLGKA